VNAEMNNNWLLGVCCLMLGLLAGTVSGQTRNGDIGACCLPNGECIEFTSELDCLSSGGEWQGTNTFCPDLRGETGPVQCEPDPPPVNDDCEDAIAITSFDMDFVGTTVSATPDDLPLCAQPARGGIPGVWYSVIGNGSVLEVEVCVNIGQEQGLVEGLLAVFCGDCEGLDCVALELDEPAPCFLRGNDLDVEFCSEFGREYLIFVALDEPSSTASDFVISVNDLSASCDPQPCGPLPNDDCEDAILLTTSDGFLSGTSSGATPDDIPVSCFGDIEQAAGGVPTGVWYKVIGTGNFMIVDLCVEDDFAGNLGGGTDVAVGVFCGSCSAPQCVTGTITEAPSCLLNNAASSGIVEWCSEQGREYYIFVEVFGEDGPDPRGNGFDPEAFEIAVFDSGFDSCEPEPCGGAADFCEDAQLVCPGEIYFGNTFDATNDYLDHGASIDTIFFCGLFFGLYDVWYKYEPAVPGLLFVHVEGPPTEYVFGVYDSCSSLPEDLLACNIARHHGVIVMHVQPEETYYIRIAGYGTSRGEFQLDLVGPPCENGITELAGD